jgi:hypothetical protein
MVERKKKPVKDKKPLPLSALDRTKAVLSVWAERRKPSEICRSLDVKWTVLRNWEDRALQGMLQALAPRRRREQAPPLSDRLEKLLGKKEEKGEVLRNRLHARLTTLQESKLQESKSGKEEKVLANPPEPKKG